MISASDENTRTAIRDLVIANHILGHEGVVDAFGHVSVRHPGNPDRYFLSRSRSPELIEATDILEFDLDSNGIDLRGQRPYAERFIHGSVYKARADAMAVCHSHAYDLVPFTVTDTGIKPIWVFSASIGPEVPIWDIRDDFPDPTNMLIVNDEIGASMTRALGPRSACLLRGHGAVVATAGIKNTVMASMGLKLNAEMLLKAHLLAAARGSAANIRYLSDGEIRSTTEVLYHPGALDRAWEYWSHRAGFKTDDDGTAR
jgi:ribulose-5-phosphate 4-epimerase/fuculose-1-phosphate aldolase